MTSSSSFTSASGQLGATIITAYASREVKAYPVFENEIKTFSYFNTLASACFSAASAFASGAGGIWVNSKFTEKLTPAGELLVQFVVPVGFVLAAILLGFAVWAACSKASTWKTIKGESNQTSSEAT